MKLLRFERPVLQQIEWACLYANALPEPPTDLQTTATGAGNVCSGMHLSDGRRLLPDGGPVLDGASNRTERTLRLGTGTYFWTVQTIDTGYEGSAVLDEQSFSVP